MRFRTAGVVLVSTLLIFGAGCGQDSPDTRSGVPVPTLPGLSGDGEVVVLPPSDIAQPSEPTHTASLLPVRSGARVVAQNNYGHEHIFENVQCVETPFGAGVSEAVDLELRSNGDYTNSLSPTANNYIFVLIGNTRRPMPAGSYVLSADTVRAQDYRVIIDAHWQESGDSGAAGRGFDSWGGGYDFTIELGPDGLTGTVQADYTADHQRGFTVSWEC